MPPIRIHPGDDRFIGKSLLVGITYLDSDGEFIRQEQFWGPIAEAHKNHIVMVRNDTGEAVSLPPEVEEADPGEYRLRSTGEVVVDPDYLAKWEKQEPAPEAA
ncbi:MAG: hypothetical protein IT445_14895 [Phycisphaeraceae bacterium]|nr:hypothetical protein [Phycisphaeraceae bacterium]